jgi:hypothetical protein
MSLALCIPVIPAMSRVYGLLRGIFPFHVRLCKDEWMVWRFQSAKGIYFLE